LIYLLPIPCGASHASVAGQYNERVGEGSSTPCSQTH
jgi:hypothetical protein